MAHELEMTNGKASMFYVGKEKPWHGLGVQLDNPPTVQEAIAAAGLDWTVSVFPMYAELQRDNGTITMPARSRMVVRDSDNRRLSEVGPDWTPLQNIHAFEWFQPFLDSGEATLDTAGSLFDGQKIWVLAKLNRDPMNLGGGDTINKFLLLSNAHSDKASVRPAFVSIRTVCNNTLTAGLAAVGAKSIRVRHSHKVMTNLNMVRDTINAANASFDATAEQYQALTKRQINQNDLRKYINVVFKQKDTEETELNKDDARLIENKITPIFESGLGSDLSTSKGTLWGAYQAINTWLNWERGRTQDARLDSLWFGASQKVDQVAFNEALKMLA